MIRMDPNADLLIEWNIRLRSNRRGEAPVRGKKCRKQKASHPPEILKHRHGREPQRRVGGLQFAAAGLAEIAQRIHLVDQVG